MLFERLSSDERFLTVRPTDPSRELEPSRDEGFDFERRLTSILVFLPL